MKSAKEEINEVIKKLESRQKPQHDELSDNNDTSLSAFDLMYNFVYYTDQFSLQAWLKITFSEKADKFLISWRKIRIRILKG